MRVVKIFRDVSDSNVGGISLASFISRRIVPIPVPFASASCVSWKIELMLGLRIRDPGSPRVSAGFKENQGLIISILLEYRII